MKPKQDVQILIVEDDPLVGEMIRGTLEKLGYTIAGEALDGQQAVAMTQYLRPDVILMDLELPEMDGIEATRCIFQSCPTPVVVLTSYETPGLVEQASAAGVGAYLVKLPLPQDLDRAIIVAMARFDDIMTLRRLNAELQAALAKVKTLSGLLPICASCKKIRDDQGYWHQVEGYIRDHTDAEFSHGICPDCARKIYPDYFKE